MVNDKMQIQRYNLSSIINEVLKEISNIKNIRSKSQPARKAKQIAINYYEQHEDRMLYKTYIDKGLLIG